MNINKNKIINQFNTFFNQHYNAKICITMQRPFTYLNGCTIYYCITDLNLHWIKVNDLGPFAFFWIPARGVG